MIPYQGGQHRLELSDAPHKDTLASFHLDMA
jgi:hypothetical protein